MCLSVGLCTMVCRLVCLARVLEGWCPNEMFMHLPFFLSAHMYFVTESCLVLYFLYSSCKTQILLPAYKHTLNPCESGRFKKGDIGICILRLNEDFCEISLCH